VTINIEENVYASVETSETAFVSCGDEAGQTVVAQIGPPGNQNWGLRFSFRAIRIRSGTHHPDVS
jgi:hypothetical protein